MSFEDIPAVIDHAIRLEEATAAFYDHLLNLDLEPEAATLVRSLVAQEKKHAKQLAEFKKTCTAAGFIQNLPAFPQPTLDLLAERRRLSLGDLLQIAMQVEVASRDFYQSVAQLAPNEPMRKLFGALTRFEQSHIDLLTRHLAYSN
ncbi:MAG: hypothetical protein OZSIB_2637 [Candidatus Ozemobacter sibiricus]|jgi:rubrerythrin|uniref:Rubrerythrin diiron-binding domain-containing protein n=1 Tax=Candidatus Ozemobacter sibiricus TaxID=2268124 RepID=A0A367ZSQ6_9BACT|nr:MAG: hypothetical protein OZSIB_2637 [Candidatus Ozemobacter sibiricus]